jgi:hypothetical protein
MTLKAKGWRFSPHARARIAKRIGLLMDMKAEAEISKTLDSLEAKVVKTNFGRTLYEIKVFGVAMIAVCSPEDRVVVTFMDAKKWRRKYNGRQRRHSDFRPKESKESSEEE